VVQSVNIEQNSNAESAAVLRSNSRTVSDNGVREAQTPSRAQSVEKQPEAFLTGAKRGERPDALTLENGFDPEEEAVFDNRVDTTLYGKSRLRDSDVCNEGKSS
jgi:hypothetical protein